MRCPFSAVPACVSRCKVNIYVCSLHVDRLIWTSVDGIIWNPAISFVNVWIITNGFPYRSTLVFFYLYALFLSTPSHYSHAVLPIKILPPSLNHETLALGEMAACSTAEYNPPRGFNFCLLIVDTSLVQCPLCTHRLFANRPAVEHHWRDSTAHAWCEGCNLLFKRKAERLAHYEDPAHVRPRTVAYMPQPLKPGSVRLNTRTFRAVFFDCMHLC